MMSHRFLSRSSFAVSFTFVLSLSFLRSTVCELGALCIILEGEAQEVHFFFSGDFLRFSRERLFFRNSRKGHFKFY